MTFEGRRGGRVKRQARLRLRLWTIVVVAVLLGVAAGLWYANISADNALKETVKTAKKTAPDKKAASAKKPAPPRAVPQYYIKAALDDQKYLIRGELELKALNPGTPKLLFYAYPPWSPMRISAVKINGKAVQFEFEGKNLVFANDPAQREIQVQIQFETPVPRAGTRFGVKDNTWLITSWYPMLGALDKNRQWIKRPEPRGMGDPFFFRFADYKVEWTSPADIKWVTSGALKSDKIAGLAGSQTTNTGDSADSKSPASRADSGAKKAAANKTEKSYRTTVWQVEQVRNFALVGSPDYIVKRFKLNDKTTVSIALTETAKMEEVLQIARNTYPLFTRIYGELPYKEVAIAETGYKTNYALEYPNLAIYSKDMYRNDKIQHWITHEVGHTWWYNAVGVDETVDGWLDEGLVEHGVVWYLEQTFPKERAAALRNQYRAEHKKLNAGYPGRTMDVGLYGFKNFREFDYSWYSRSADMFLTFRQALGDERYIAFLNRLYTNNLGKIADEKSLDKALADSAGLKTDFFARWLHQPYNQTSWTVKLEDTNSEQ